MSKKNQIIPVISKEKLISKQQKTFNSRIKTINKLKADVESFKAYIEELKPRIEQKIKPLEREMAQKRVDYVLQLDKYYPEKFFRKKEKELMANLIMGELFDLIDNFGYEDLKELYDKYSEDSFDEEKKASNLVAKDMAKNMFSMFGFDTEGWDDFSADDMNDQAKIFEFLQDKAKKMADKKWEQENQKQSKSKTKAQQEKEEKAKAEAKRISQTTRTIYADLVKELHPDREQDEQKKEEKTEIMKQVTAAYNNDDFFALLQLQIEYLQKDSEHLAELDEDQLKYYNKILMEQQRELQGQLNSFQHAPPPFNELLDYSVEQSEKKFKNKIKELKNGIKALEYTLSTFEKEGKQGVRSYLKEQANNQDDDIFDVLFNFR